MVPFILVGMLLWAVAGLLLLIAGAPTDWLWICLAGFLLGIPATAVMVLRDRRRRQPRSGQP